MSLTRSAAGYERVQVRNSPTDVPSVRSGETFMVLPGTPLCPGLRVLPVPKFSKPCPWGFMEASVLSHGLANSWACGGGTQSSALPPTPEVTGGLEPALGSLGWLSRQPALLLRGESLKLPH